MSTAWGGRSRQTGTTGRLILDSGGLLALSEGNSVARAAIERAHREGYVLVIPTPVLAEGYRLARAGESLHRIAGAVDALLPTSPAIARLASSLLKRTPFNDSVAAIVAAEALAAPPAVVLTSRGWTLRRLLHGRRDADRLTIVDVEVRGPSTP